MQWIKPSEAWPSHNGRYLGFCENFDADDLNWKGIVDIHFDSRYGWRRSENNGEKLVRVIYWCIYPNTPQE